MANALVLTYPELDCWDDVALFAGTLPSDLAALIQDFYHFLIEPPGSNIDDDRRGAGLPQLLSGPVQNLTTAANKIDQLAPEIFSGRIDNCKTSISIDPNSDPPSYTVFCKVGVNGSVYGAQFAFNSQAGLSLVNWGNAP